MKISIKEYLSKNPSYLVAALILAANGEPEILIKMVGSEKAAFDLLQDAKRYGNDAKIWGIHDFPITLSQDGKISKKTWRIAGLLLTKQEFFFGMICNQNPENEIYAISKEDKKTLDNAIKFFFEGSSEVSDTDTLDTFGDTLGVTARPAKKKV